MIVIATIKDTTSAIQKESAKAENRNLLTPKRSVTGKKIDHDADQSARHYGEGNFRRPV